MQGRAERLFVRLRARHPLRLLDSGLRQAVRTGGFQAALTSTGM